MLSAPPAKHLVWLFAPQARLHRQSSVGGFYAMASNLWGQ